jgi:hypothetical protein
MQCGASLGCWRGSRGADRNGAMDAAAVRFRRIGAVLTGIGHVNSYRLTRHAILLSAAALAMAMADAQHGRAHGQGKLDARYSVTLGGLPIGRGSWVIDIGDDHFSTAASGATAGVMRVFTSGQGQSAARGTVSGGHLVPSSYASSIYTDKKYDEVRMVISSGTVKEFTAEPPNTPNPARVPVTDAHRRGVSDPMTAPLVRVPGSGDTVVPQACQRTLSIFDGRMRYDLQLAFKRLSRAGCGLRSSFLADCRTRSRPLRAQVSRRSAGHRNVACADCRHANHGALPSFGAHSHRSWRHGGHPIRLHCATGQDDGENAVMLSIDDSETTIPGIDQLGLAGEMKLTSLIDLNAASRRGCTRSRVPTLFCTEM